MRFTTIIARNLTRRGVRSALTVLGLAIGIAAVVSLLGIAWGFERSFMHIYEAKGIDLVVVRAGVSDRLTSSLDETLAAKVRAVPGVKDVGASLMDTVSFEDANLVSVLVNGWVPGSLLFRGIRPIQGRTLRAGDTRSAMLGRILALNLNQKVGDTIDVAGERFRVVGVYESDSMFENGGLIIPQKELQAMMGREGQVTGFVIAAEDHDPGQVRAVGKAVEAALPNVAAVPARDFMQGEALIRLAKAMAWATSLVALVLGSVGMLNTMVMSVFERTGEIGVLRALGWKRRRVLTLILGEALALGLAGAVVGVVLGYAGIRAITLFPTARGFISNDLPPLTVAFGLALAIVLSLLGGLYPALRAAALDPTEALRHE
jgi:putative ABC transport system permease protein